MQFNSGNLSISEHNACLVGQCLSGMNEEMLISAARSGDKSAFQELYVRHSRKVLPSICRIIKNREDAEEVLQEAALRAFLHFQTFEARSTFRTWLHAIAIKSALMTLRKKRAAEFSIEQMSHNENSSRSWEPRDNAETPESRYARCEREELLVGAIQRLPGILREILELQRSNEYSTRQIAEELGISISAAKSRLMRARKLLRQFSQVRIHSGLTSNSTTGFLTPRIRSRATAVRA